ncbi:MAG TPA: hypothetical protein VN380_09540 [Thermoanaerobaculia bacterium]|jgi:hypothetical protein|nr:hypothetical protein [Thermoanaerobaculia bacterium]
MLNKTESLRGGLTAAVVACSLAIFGCSTNRTPGDGQPSMTPSMNPAATPGSSSGTTNPPMASAMDSSTSVQRANDAAAIVAAHQRERFLGYINPTGPQPNPPGQMPVTGQVVPPSMYTNPEVTVNASISSEPTPVITSGADGSDDEAAFLAAVSAASAPTTGATNSATATPATAALSAMPGQFTAGPSTTSATAATTAAANTATPTPTLSSAATPSPTRAANPPLTIAGVTSSPTTTGTSSKTSPTLATGRLIPPSGVVTNGSVRAVASASGAVTITNMPVVIKSK